MNKIISVSVVVVSVFISFFVLYTPLPNNEDETIFNTKLAIEHIQEIAKEPHSVYDEEAHDDVQAYLEEQLDVFIGQENTQTFFYDRSMFEDEDGNPLEYDVTNILGHIPGKSDTGILLVAHYDSRGHIGRSGELGGSYGAADDGYGLAVMLEIARLYGNQDIENSIYLLFTDAEETGLYGASMAAQEDFMDNIGFVINIEARGVQGPAYMFETSVNNDKVIDFYTNADLEVSYSLATAVYTVMPNSTDFTEFLSVGKQGVNFAVLNGLFYYHTPHDNYTNINPSSIEHYGRQIVPLVEEFVSNPIYSDVSYFEAESNQVFFTFLPNVFIHYNEVTGSIIHSLIGLVLLGLIVLMFIQKQLKFSSLGNGFIYNISFIIFAVLIGNIVARVVAFVSKVPFNMTYVRTEIGGIPTLVTLLVITIIYYLVLDKLKNNKMVFVSMITSGALINSLLALASGFALSGAGFLFMVPALLSTVLLGLIIQCKYPLVKRIVLSIGISFSIILILPILFSLYLALTIGGLLALGAILVFYLFSLVPSILVVQE